MAVGDSLLRGVEVAVCQPDLFAYEVCCLPGARIWNVMERLPRLIKPISHYTFLLMKRIVEDYKGGFPVTGSRLD